MKLANHKWLRSGLLGLGWEWKSANLIAFRYLMGHTLFPNELADARAVMATLEAK